MMEIITRRQWGARHSAGFRAAPTPARSLWLHHTVTRRPNDDDPAAERAAVREIEQVGQDRFGGGVSYTFLVMPSGRVYEGTGYDREGAHTRGFNTHGRAIALVGNYDRDIVPSAMSDAVAALVAHGADQQWWPDQLSGGHRDAPGSATACPGRHAHPLVDEINGRARTVAQNGALHMSWDGPPIPDWYRENLPPLPSPKVALGWATAHAARARDYAHQGRDRATEARDVAVQARDTSARGLDELHERLDRIEQLLTGRAPTTESGGPGCPLTPLLEQGNR